jgi:MraZ protein
MFMSEYNHSIDAKGRVIVPVKFREALGDEFVVTQGLDGCLFVFPDSEWKAFEEKLKSLPMANKDARKFVRFFLAGAALVEIDKQGRILIPPVLREFAALEKDVVVVGVGSRVEIWDKARWNDSTTFEDMDEIANHMTDLGLII